MKSPEFQLNWNESLFLKKNDFVPETAQMKYTDVLTVNTFNTKC